MKVSLIVGAIVVIVLIAVVFVMNKKEAPPAPAQVSVPTAEDPRAAQKQFLVDNLKKEGWKATDSGLQYKVIKSVEAGPKPAPGSKVTVHYEGTSITGDVFDSSYARGESISFGLNQVITGWGEGVPLMKEGETFEFAIPSNLAYGERGAPPKIKGGDTLIFKIELLKVHTPAP